MKYDVVIIGAGILGCLTARELMRYNVSVLVVDKESDLAEGATKANSGVLYAGFHPRGGSLKGISCVKGNRMHKELCKDLDVPMEYVGSLFVAFHDEGMEQIAEKMKKGEKNGVPGMKLISGREARALEPSLSPHVIGAMYAPTTGIISPFRLALHTAYNAAENGAAFQFNTEVEAIEAEGQGYCVHTNQGPITAKFIVNTSGEGAAQMETFVHQRDLIIKPRKGEYLVFDCPSPISHVIYQAQENDEKGTLVTPTVDGNMLAGPTSYNVRKYSCTETSRKGHEHIMQVAQKILPDLDLGTVIASFAGVRANIENVPKEEKDFVIRRSSRGFVSALGIKNPGMTASPYLVKKILELLFEEGLAKELNCQFNPTYRATPLYLKSKPHIQKGLMEKNPAYGRAICRCEEITEGDILTVLKAPLPPHNINGLKKRLRTGMGRCQGGFCTPEIIEILSNQWGILPEAVTKNGPGSNYVKGRVRR